MTYQQSTRKLAELAEDQLTTLADRHMRGELSLEDVRALAMTVLTRSRRNASALADTALAMELSRLWSTFVAPLGLSITADRNGYGPVALAVDTTVGGEAWKVNAAAAMTVLGRAQVMDAAQETYAAGMKDHGVEWWQRDVEPGACELCQSFDPDAILPMSMSMYHHKGCGCTQRPFNPQKEN